MMDFDHAFPRVDYRQEIIKNPPEKQLLLLEALNQICSDSTPALNELRLWLADVVTEAYFPIPANPRRHVVKEQRTGKITYRLERVNCGKERCKKCKKAPSHGPYWYGYWREGGKLKSKYIGKELKDLDCSPPGQSESVDRSQVF